MIDYNKQIAKQIEAIEEMIRMKDAELKDAQILINQQDKIIKDLKDYINKYRVKGQIKL